MIRYERLPTFAYCAARHCEWSLTACGDGETALRRLRHDAEAHARECGSEVKVITTQVTWIAPPVREAAARG